MDIEKILQQVGLNDREAKVYLAALELGSSTVFPIAQKAEIKRTYCYDILADLQKKGLVYFIEKNNRRRYTAENPNKIAEMMKLKLDDFKAILPDLRAIYNNKPDKPKVRYYEGKEGVLSIYQEILKAKPKELDAISSPNKIEAAIGAEFADYLKKIIDTGIISRDLITKDSSNPKTLSALSKPQQQIRFLPDSISLKTDTMMFDNKLVMISYSDDIHAIVVESSAIVETQKALFEILWRTSAGL